MDDFERKFWSKVEKTDTCWLWIGTIRSKKPKQGYGSIKKNGIAKQAHRISWEIKNGLIPQGMFICHKCDNPRCVNPDHLFLGTQTDNMQDCKRKGRNMTPDRLGYGFKKGHPSLNAKISFLTAQKIREDYLRTKTPYRELAKKYGINFTVIGDIVRGEIWKSLA